MPQKASGKSLERIKSLMGIRDIVNDLLSGTAKGGNDASADHLRAKLNKAYDAFVKNTDLSAARHGRCRYTRLQMAKMASALPCAIQTFPGSTAIQTSTRSPRSRNTMPRQIPPRSEPSSQ